jgi:hypothetical protein
MAIALSLSEILDGCLCEHLSLFETHLSEDRCA